MAKIWAPSSLFLVLYFAMVILPWADATVPAVFILGDSTADVGTNSYLPESTVRADFLYNGIDFPSSRATGRFSNGLNSADFLAKLMGFKRSPPPFLSLLNRTTYLKKQILRGVNFASGGSGLLNITGQTLKVVPLEEQIQQFATVRSHLTGVMGVASTEEMLSKSVFFISIGSNDIFGYYYSNTSVPKQEFMTSLGFTYENHLKNLINLGARKFGIISVPPIGCCPSQRIFNATGGCLEELNDDARAFHSMVDNLLDRLSSEFEGMKYSLGNTYEMTINIIGNPLPFKFKDVASACCGAGNLNGESLCNPEANLCSNRNEYLFWDLYHPTQAASKLAALTLYGGSPRFVAPINFSQLVQDS